MCMRCSRLFLWQKIQISRSFFSINIALFSHIFSQFNRTKRQYYENRFFSVKKQFEAEHVSMSIPRNAIIWILLCLSLVMDGKGAEIDIIFNQWTWMRFAVGHVKWKVEIILSDLCSFGSWDRNRFHFFFWVGNEFPSRHFCYKDFFFFKFKFVMKISFFQWHFGNFLLSIRKFGVRSSLCNFMLLFLFPLSFRRVKKGKLCCVYHKKVAKCLLTKQTYIVYRKLVKQTWKCFVLSFCVPIQGSKIKVRQSCQVEKKTSFCETSQLKPRVISLWRLSDEMILMTQLPFHSTINII